MERKTPILHIISDSLGVTAATIAAAASTQFTDTPCVIHRMPMVTTIDQVTAFIDASLEFSEETLILLHTLADPDLRCQLEEYVQDKDVIAVDLLGRVIDAISTATDQAPREVPGLYRRPSEEYFARVRAMDFAVEHDDGRNSEQLGEADIVLVGVSRTSKTPLSIYLATFGYKVANVPLILGIEPPAELFEVDPQRIFGLVSNTQLLSEIRYRNLGNAASIASTYADPSYVQDDLDESRQVMRTLGCVVIHTDNRAIEESAQEILRYYRLSFPSPKTDV